MVSSTGSETKTWLPFGLLQITATDAVMLLPFWMSTTSLRKLLISSTLWEIRPLVLSLTRLWFHTSCEHEEIIYSNDEDPTDIHFINTSSYKYTSPTNYKWNLHHSRCDQKWNILKTQPSSVSISYEPYKLTNINKSCFWGFHPIASPDTPQQIYSLPPLASPNRISDGLFLRTVSLREG